MSRRLSVVGLVALGVLSLPGCRRETDVGRTASASPSAPRNAASQPVSTTAKTLRVELRRASEKDFEVRFSNTSHDEQIILRPLSGGLLKPVPGLPGHTVLPGASYKLEATDLARGRVYRGLYDPQAMFSALDESENAAREKGRGRSAVDSEVSLPPQGSATLSVDLPFTLAPGTYSLRFWYEYFQSSHLVPAHWYTGVIAAPPIALVVK